MADPAKPRPRPCASCPYRRNAPSGLWDASEYVKLPEYDGETYMQPTAAFFCHHADGAVCSGWLGHTIHPHNLLAVRIGVSSGSLDPSCMSYQTDVPLFSSGAEAAEHGMRDIELPGAKALEAMRKIQTKEERNGV